MTNIVAPLLVLALTGAPFANVMCLIECAEAPAPATHCHVDAASEGPMVLAGVVCSDPSLSEGPYLVERRAAPDAAVLIGTSPVATPAMAWTDAPAVFAGSGGPWLRPPVVLRL